MKKAVSLIAAAAAVAVIASGVLVWKTSRQTPLPPPARFLPPDTILFIEAPDWPRTSLRWKETALWKIIHEPDVASFLQRPRAWLGKNAPSEKTMVTLGNVHISRVFFALASVRHNMPHAAAGFEFSGDRSEVEAVIAKVRAQARVASPGGKAERIKYRDYEIESFSDKGVTLAGAFARDWYFFGNDVELLKTTLDRFSAPKAEGSLAGADTYVKCAAHLPDDPDFKFFAQPSVFVDELLVPSFPAEKTVDFKQAAKLRKIRAIAGGMRQEGERLHDTVFILTPNATKQPTLTRSTLHLTSSNTLFYCAFAPSIPDHVDLPAEPLVSPDAGNSAPLAGILNGLRALTDEFGERGVRSGNFKAALGPEFAVFSDWPKDALQPTLQIAGQVRDAAAARKLGQALADTAPFSSLAGTDGGGYWSLATANAPFSPVLALTKRFLVAGTSPNILATLAATERGRNDTLEQSGAFSATVASVNKLHKPETALVYLDSKALFEHVYGWVRPMALVWGNFIPHAADYMDVGKLPRTESISKHLSPLVISAFRTGDGVVMESTGPVTFFQAAAALSVASGAAAVPLLESKVLLPGLIAQKKLGLNAWGVSPGKPGPAQPAPGASSPAATPAP